MLLNFIFCIPKTKGKVNKYTLYKDDRKVYEGLSTSYQINNLSPNSYFSFYIVFCNNFYCSSTKTNAMSLSTDESLPTGSIILEAEATGSNQIELKWTSEENDPLVANGVILYAVFINGPFLVEYNNMDDLSEIIKSKKTFINIENRNLLNTTVYNTKYGILDRILPYSNYLVQVNASNSKGFILSNQVRVETFKSVPDLVLPPQFVLSTDSEMKIEWFNPILINSEDKTIFFQVEYKTKYLWNSNGSIVNPAYEKEVKTIFKTGTLATLSTLTNLVPFSAFTFRLTASNTYGQSKSDWSEDYFTKEQLPRMQASPTVLSFNSNSAFLRWTPPQFPNGKILFFRLNIFEYQNKTSGSDDSFALFRNISVDSILPNEYNVTSLEAYTIYVFTVEACNSMGCVSSRIDEKNNQIVLQNMTYIRTDPAAPDLFEEPTLFSYNSFSVDIAWKMPSKPNGDIAYYILERFDYSLPLNIKISQNKTVESSNKTVKYRFEKDKFNFVDYENLESCGVYSYRLFVFNQVGNKSTNWVNITVKHSKPLIVTSPVVNFIDSRTARFEWMKPLTYCSIKSYNLQFRSELGVVFHVDIDTANTTTQSVLVKNLVPFTIYDLLLTACVNIDKDACTQSLTKKFQTSGDVPQGLSVPVARLISYKTISVEWLDPIYKNGIYLLISKVQFTIIACKIANVSPIFIFWD